MSWLIVVAGLVAVAIGVHFAEQRKSKAIIAKKRAELDERRRGLHKFSYREDIQETWEADLQAMSLRFTRASAGGPSVPPVSYALERDADGGWRMYRTPQLSPEQPAASRDWQPLPARIVQRLETHYQRFIQHAVADSASKPGR